ncbi:heat shock factor 2-binding protein-like isoform X1 [Hydra vulgaris]|uniref:heat shock factor 2-binding protein-like isoform X1 n=1 Tax=Hydra vulgaris TaxID=6087 RepID=UPI0032E9FA29
MDSLLKLGFDMKKVVIMQETYVLVPKTYMNQVMNEVKILKETLPKALNRRFFKDSKSLDKEKEKEFSNERKLLEQELEFSKERKLLEQEFDLLKKRYDSLLSEVERERQENADLRKQLFELKEITEEQSTYCATLGGTTCGLLWRISQNEDSIHMLLGGDNADEFFQLACHTLESYVNAVHSSPSRVVGANNEYRFVISLMGVITNITASSFGRELLSSKDSGKEVLNAINSVISEFPFQEMKWMKMRNVALKCMYNISINQKGMKFLCSIKTLLPDLSQVIHEDKFPDNKLHALRLLQSMVCEPDCVELLHSVVELLSIDKLKTLSQNSKGEVLSAFQDLIADLLLLTR